MQAPHPREAHYLKLDVSKAKAELGWEPVLPLIKALDWIVEWYRTVPDRRRPSVPHAKAN